MASIAIQCPMRAATTRLWLFERTLPYFAFVPFTYFVYTHLVSSIKKKVVLDAKTGKIKQTFIISWLKQIGVDRVVMRDIPIRTRALGVLDRASYSSQFHASALSMVARVVNLPEFIEVGKAAMFNVCAIVVKDEKVQKYMKKAFTNVSFEKMYFISTHSLLRRPRTVQS